MRAAGAISAWSPFWERYFDYELGPFDEGFKPTTDFGPVPFTEVGRGAIDWKKVFAAAKKARVKRYYVEQDTTERPALEAITISRDYLHDLKVE